MRFRIRQLLAILSVSLLAAAIALALRSHTYDDAVLVHSRTQDWKLESRDAAIILSRESHLPDLHDPDTRVTTRTSLSGRTYPTFLGFAVLHPMYDADIIRVPFWFILLAFTIAPLRHLALRPPARIRNHLLCLKCGYDLRASQHRCPECGTPFSRDLEAVPA